MVCRGTSLFSCAEVTFSNCKIDLQSLNPNNKMTGGKLHLSGNSSGAQLYFGFEMTGGTIDGSTGLFGFVVTQGATTFKGGTVDLTADYPFYLTNGATVDFAGANVTGTSTANCGLYVNSGSGVSRIIPDVAQNAFGAKLIRDLPSLSQKLPT